MQSGSVNQGTKSFIKRQSPAEVKEQQEQTPASPALDQAESSTESVPTLPLGVVMDVAPDALRTSDDGKGGYESEMTLAFVPKKDKERLQGEGAIFPEVKQAVLGDGVGEKGSLEVVPLYESENPNSVNLARAIATDKELLEIDPGTGQPKIDSHRPIFLAPEEGVLGADQMAVPKGSNVIPQGYSAQLGLSDAGRKTESRRHGMNHLANKLGTFSASSLSGLWKLPVITQLAPILALGTAGFTLNQNLEARKTAQDQLAYLDQQQKKSTDDVVTMQLPSGREFSVSGRNERIRLESQASQAKMQLISTGLLAAAGGASIVGTMASAGVAGFASLGFAAAATPFLAGGAMVLGNGAMVFNSLNQLKQLSKERAELLEAQGKGETHVERVIEVNDPELKRPVAFQDRTFAVPISERLKQVESEQRKQRLLATAMSGAMVSIGGTLMGAAPLVLGPAALAPAGLLLAGQSIKQLQTLSTERKELAKAQAEGKTMLERELQQPDGHWKKERVPISTLMAENTKSRNKNIMILTSVGSVGALAGLTAGMGMSVLAAAPIAAIPLAIGAALFPDKVKAFADKVMGLISGAFGEAGQTARATQERAEAEVDKFSTRLDEKFASLKESNPELFADRPGRMPLTKMKYGGYFTEMKNLVKDYASAKTQAERLTLMQTIEEAMAQAPDSAKAAMGTFREELTSLSMEVEAQWLARDIALEMKTPVVDKVVKDDRVQARVKELEFPTDNLRDQYEESLFIDGSPHKAAKLFEASAQGDREASRLLARTQVFSAARQLAFKERDLGVDLFTRYMDALQRPEDQDNLELLLKEVGYRQQIAVTEEEVGRLNEAVKTLSTPLTLAPEAAGPYQAKLQASVRQLEEADPGLAQQLVETDRKISSPETFQGMTAQQALAERTKLNAQFQAARRGLRDKAPEALKQWQEAGEKLQTLGPAQTESLPQPVILKGPEARMENAFRALSQEQPKLAKELGEAFAQLNSPTAFSGMNTQEVQQGKLAASLKLNEVREKLQKKEPELMKLWDGARAEVEKAYFDRSIDHDFKSRVLSTEDVSQAAQSLGISNDEVEGLYMGLMRSQILHDPRDLQARLADQSGKQVDPKRAEMLSVIDRAMMKTAAQVTQGGADFEPTPAAPPLPAQDPEVLRFLEQQPHLLQVMESEPFQQLAAQMQLPPEDVKGAYLTLIQANLNPVIGAELNGRLEAGDMETVKMFQVGQAVDGLVNEMTRPDPEAVAQHLEASMQGIVAQSVLQHPEIQELAGNLGVDASASLRLLLHAELSRDPSALQQLEAQAQKGDALARNQLQMLQSLSQAVLHFSNQAAQQLQNPAPQEVA